MQYLLYVFSQVILLLLRLSYLSYGFYGLKELRDAMILVEVVGFSSFRFISSYCFLAMEIMDQMNMDQIQRKLVT